MKKTPAYFLAALIMVVPAAAMAADALQSLNMRPEAARTAVTDTFLRGIVTLPSGYVAFWSMDDAHRAALVPPLLTIVRGYVESTEFATKINEGGAGQGRVVGQLVAERLRQFLELSADVDFRARMVKKESLVCFADPKLEARSAEWKLCYRAGPKTLAAARTFARDWLTTLDVSAEQR